MKPRSVGLAVFAVLTIDLLFVVLSANLGLFGGVGRVGFALRLIALGALGAWLWRRSRPVLLFGACTLVSLYQFQYAGGRINGDGLMYYPYVRSLWKDCDLDFTNEYDYLGLLRQKERADLRVLTKTGKRRSIFSIGPAVAWTPFFGLGEGSARLQRAAGFDVDLSGFGPHHRNAVALGSFVMGVGALLLIHATLGRHFRPGVALGATLLVWGATFLHWYMVQQPTMSHAPSAFAAALAVFLWDRWSGRRSAAGHLWLGLALGFAMCIRWQNGVLLLLPATELAVAAWRRSRPPLGIVSGGVLLALGTFAGAFPQMAAWKTLYDEWLLRAPPHGADFLRLDHPFFWETFFSSRHGLLSWTPIFWAGYLGFVPLLRHRRGVALVLLLPLTVMTYVNLCSGDWWAGGSFSNRRFDSLLPILAFGIAATVELAIGFVARRPQAAVATIAAGAILWNATLVAQVRRGLVPRDDTVSFPRLVGGSTRLFGDAVGFPTTWPASWLFAVRYDRPPSQFDALVGKYLFYRQNNLGGRIDVGNEIHEGLVGEGFAPIEAWHGRRCRRLLGTGRVFAPLDAPEDLEIGIHVRAGTAGRMGVSVNGRPLGTVDVGPAWDVPRILIARENLAGGINTIGLGSDAPVTCIEVVEFRRTALR